MTYEELLKKIVVDDYYNADEVLVQQNALRAVVELHKPEYGENAWNPDINWLNCTICFTEGNLEETSSSLAYPCPTIQAIEKERYSF